MRPRLLNSAPRAFLLLYVALTLLPLRYHSAGTGLDASWAVALNLFHAQGVVHGRDVAFTYGPLAYLALPMPMGSNLEQGIAFQLMSWAAFCIVLGWLFLEKRIWMPLAIAFALLSVPAAGLLHDFGYAGPDFFLESFVLVCLAGSAISSSVVLAVAAGAATVVLLLIKWTSGVAALTGLILFAGAKFFQGGRRAAVTPSLTACAAPLLFLGAFLIYEPSWRSLVRELRAGYELSAGFSSAMSSTAQGNALTMAIVLMVGYLVLVVALIALRLRAWGVAVAGLGPLFVEFKHSFVREGGHAEIFFCFVALLAGVVMLALPRCHPRHWPVAVAFIFMAAPWVLRDGRKTLSFISEPARAVSTLRDTAGFSTMKQRLAAESKAALAVDALSPELRARIGERTITIFPSEVSYAAANALHYVPLPIFQTYSAYTGWLDDWNAALLDDWSHAPEMVLFEWTAIDERHPLLDVPATALALYRNYEFDSAFGGKLLLRKRQMPIPRRRETIGTGRLILSKPLELPETNRPLIGRMHLQPTLRGRLQELLFRVPSTIVTLSGPEGRFVVARVPPRVVSNGLIFNFLPVNLSEFRRLMEKNEVEEPLRHAVIGGEATRLYQAEADYEVDTFPDAWITIAAATPLPILQQMADRGVLDSAKIEMLGGQGVMNRSDRELVSIAGAAGYITLSGWAVVQPGSKVFVDLDGKLARVLRRQRLDIGMLYGEAVAPDAGLEWSASTWTLGTSIHKVRLIVVSADGRWFQEGPQTVQFRIEN